MEIKRNGFTVSLSEPILYVDNQKRDRSGHMTHALASFGKDMLIDFNSNCTANKHNGHSTFGWVEYRISEDGGETYSEIQNLPYSVKSFIDGINVISVEKAVACDDGTIVAICLRNDPTTVCQPWDTPMTVISKDGGETWSEAKELCSYKGRVYDACYHNGVIYVLEFCNDGTGFFCGEKPEHQYRIFTSVDNGENFEELCVVPFDAMGRGYGAMVFDDEGRLHVFAYNVNDERNLDHIISEDLGKTWGEPSVCYLDKGIRNPQVALMDGVFFVHGRAEKESGFVLYASTDCETFDEGTYIGTVKGWCYYSNNIVLKDKDNSNRLLIQYSEEYGKTACVNVFHRWLKVKKEE